MPSPSYADIYATCLYAAGEGLPLWNPSPLRLGDIGFVRDGTFHTLFNCIDGPPESLSNAASIDRATRSDGSRSRTSSRSSSAAQGSEASAQSEGANVGNASVGSDQNDAAGQRGRSLTAPLRRSSRLQTGSVSPFTRSPPIPSIDLHPVDRSTRSSTPPDGPFPPMPLEVDQEIPKLFDMGPRMSSNYRCLGVSLGASVVGAPVTGKIGFETSGGDGAILIPRDPTERTMLKHLGVLKAYLKTHRKWIHETYGRIEDIDVDELALIYGQDRTSDWAVAVSKDSTRGAQVEFEVLGTASSGFWGSWSHSLSASQRGPHRSTVQHSGVPFPSPESSQSSEDVAMDVDGAAASVNVAYRKTRRATRSPTQRFRWQPSNAIPPDQSIIIRRVTARTSLGLGFLPARLKASAEPKDPKHNSGDDEEGAAGAAVWKDDPLDALHHWMQQDVRVKVSLASDDDCIRLLALGLQYDPAILSYRSLSAALLASVRKYALIDVDSDGIATARIIPPPRRFIIRPRDCVMRTNTITPSFSATPIMTF